jgi:hypothetical protein
MTLRVAFRQVVLDATLCDKIDQWLVAGRWFSAITPISSTNKTYFHDIAETFLKEQLNRTFPLPLYANIVNLKPSRLSDR